MPGGCVCLSEGRLLELVRNYTEDSIMNGAGSVAQSVDHGLEELQRILVGDLAVFAEQFVRTRDVGFGLPNKWHVKEG